MDKKSLKISISPLFYILSSHSLKQLILIFGLLIPVLAFAGNFAETNKYKKSSIELSNPIINDPLPVQMESKYVTDRSLWGRLVFDRYKVSGSYQRTEDKEKIMDLMKAIIGIG